MRACCFFCCMYISCIRPVQDHGAHATRQCRVRRLLRRRQGRPPLGERDQVAGRHDPGLLSRPLRAVRFSLLRDPGKTSISGNGSGTHYFFVLRAVRFFCSTLMDCSGGGSGSPSPPFDCLFCTCQNVLRDRSWKGPSTWKTWNIVTYFYIHG